MDVLGGSQWTGGWNAVGGVYTLPPQLDLKDDQRLGELSWWWVLPRKFHPIFIQDLLCFCYCAIGRKRIMEDMPPDIFGNVTVDSSYC